MRIWTINERKYLDVRKIKRLKTQFLSFYSSMKNIHTKNNIGSFTVIGTLISKTIPNGMFGNN